MSYRLNWLVEWFVKNWMSNAGIADLLYWNIVPAKIEDSGNSSALQLQLSRERGIPRSIREEVHRTVRVFDMFFLLLQSISHVLKFPRKRTRNRERSDLSWNYIELDTRWVVSDKSFFVLPSWTLSSHCDSPHRNGMKKRLAYSRYTIFFLANILPSVRR